MKSVVGLSILALVSVGCGGSATSPWMMDELRKQAAFDMSCPAEKLTTQETGKFRYGVRGCERQATYLMHSCNRMTEECTYMMNGAVMDAPVAEQAPAAAAAPAAPLAEATPSEPATAAAAPAAEPAAEPAPTSAP